MSTISSHVLNISTGKPAVGIVIKLEKKGGNGWELLGQEQANSDGRVKDLYSDKSLVTTGEYRISFATKDYFKESGEKCFYPQVEIFFEIESNDEHYHVPLLISGHGFSTYRGS